MNIVIFAHPEFFNSLSMNKYAKTLAEGMRIRNHNVEICTPPAIFSKIPFPGIIRKWLGYIDSLIIFPIRFKKKIQNFPADTLFVISDQALGFWVHLVKDKPHVIHCHDFMALKSALGLITENPVSWSGKIYQKLIRNGFVQGKNFISVSGKTQQDLHCFLPGKPKSSQVVFNQIAPFYQCKNILTARSLLVEFIKRTKGLALDLSEGYILHVGVDVWYKNKRGVLELYIEWRQITQRKLPLIMVGKPGEYLKPLIESSDLNGHLIVLENIPEEILANAYAGASVFLFPSLEEGFGWPIAEAMACGCPVITTNLAPMTEVGGDAAFYIDRRNEKNLKSWVQKGAKVIEEVLNLSPYEINSLKKISSQNIIKFQANSIMDITEEFYKKTLDNNLINIK